MRNPYEKGSEAWSLFAAAEQLAEAQRHDSEGQDAAINRHTTALYRWVQRLSPTSAPFGGCWAEPSQIARPTC
jgi:hypothetical protein